uniref:Alcohol dehydrogenase-like N-terminal domain-containing protein n=3 Tax=Glycine subgen. Soja TaxID=1462606 RepID=A0A0R0ITL5_SOYBN
MAVPPEMEHPRKAFGWTARDTSGVLSPFKFSRRETGEKDVAFKVLYCAICHSDPHMLKNEWGISTYPLPYITSIALFFSSLNPQFFSRAIPKRRHEIAGEVTEVGSKVRNFKVGDKVGVGCMVLSCRSCQSCEDNLENYCPKMIAAMGTLDGIIDTVSAIHPLPPLLGMLKSQGKLVMVGLPEKPLELPIFPLLAGRKIIADSVIGGIKETQEMIDFAAKHDVKPAIEVIPINYVNTALECLLKADVKYRFVIDIGKTLKPSS